MSRWMVVLTVLSLNLLACGKKNEQPATGGAAQETKVETPQGDKATTPCATIRDVRLGSGSRLNANTFVVNALFTTTKVMPMKTAFFKVTATDGGSWAGDVDRDGARHVVQFDYSRDSHVGPIPSLTPAGTRVWMTMILPLPDSTDIRTLTLHYTGAGCEWARPIRAPDQVLYHTTLPGGLTVDAFNAARYFPGKTPDQLVTTNSGLLHTYGQVLRRDTTWLRTGAEGSKTARR